MLHGSNTPARNTNMSRYLSAGFSTEAVAYDYSAILNEYEQMKREHFIRGGTYLNPLNSILLNGLMTITVLITAAFSVAKLCKLHLSHHPTAHQYVIFYCATIECLICAVHWILGQYVQLDFIVQYLKLLQFLVVSHLYWVLAAHTVRKERITSRLFILVYSASLIYLTTVVIMGCINVQPDFVECLEPYWLLLSSAEFLLVQLFMFAGIYITRRLNEISTLDCVRRAQKRDLWILISAFEVSSLCGFLYDITLQSLGDERTGCSGIFYHMQQIYSPVFGSFMVIKLLLPIWAMLFVFHPVETMNNQNELLPTMNEGHYTSMYIPRFDQHQYHRLAQPGCDFLQTSEADFSPSPGADLATPVFGPLRRNTTNLTPIHEEDHELQHNIECNDQRPILS